jgi:hypothetical protein
MKTMEYHTNLGGEVNRGFVGKAISSRVKLLQQDAQNGPEGNAPGQKSRGLFIEWARERDGCRIV